MSRARSGSLGWQQLQNDTRIMNNSTDGRGEQISIHFNGDFNGASNEHWDMDAQTTTRRVLTKSTSRSYAARMSRQKSRRREFLGRPVKPGITVDTSFTRHKGTAPHQVFPQDDERSTHLVRKQSWFSSRRSSTRTKGLGITKGTPQPDHSHQPSQSIDRSDLNTATSLTPGSKTWQEISPWDRRIPIGISVPTESISEFNSTQIGRPRAGSDTTLVTPSIVITPAGAMQSVWSPDTPFTESDYTPSIYSRTPFSAQPPDVPPVPALPADVRKFSEAPMNSEPYSGAHSHSRNDTLDSAGTAFEEDDDSKRKDRIMSSGTVFEEDETPLRENTTEKSLAIDTSTTAPTQRRSQGWWNVITTPFVMTPNTATWPKSARNGESTPDVPTVPTQYGMSRQTTSPSAYTWATSDAPSPQPSLSTFATTPYSGYQEQPSTSKPSERDALNIESQRVVDRIETTGPPVSVAVTQQQTQQQSNLDRNLTSPLSAMSSTPIVSTAAIGTVLMPRQVDEQSRQININIELQDRRPLVSNQTVRANEPPSIHHVYTSAPNNNNNSSQNLPVFAPPPKAAQKGSHFSYDDISRSSSPASTPDLKESKKHRKVCDLKTMFPFGKKKIQKKQEGTQEKKKKKKRGVCFWGCCCCLIFFILLAILIPVIVVLTRRNNNNETPTTTQPQQPNQDIGNQWLNLPNYPAIPTGILTIAQPEAVEEESGCVAPTTLWSCALPKELQNSVKPNKPDQPNFQIEITFENGTAATLPKRAANPVSAGAFIRERLLRVRAALSPSPAPPSEAEMNFLGRTTDGNSAPFEGEDTPLFITFQNPQAKSSRLAKRADPSDPTNITAVIPPPMLDTDGTAAPANLLPYPVAQPLRLFNRGKDTEYYGFYSYYDRSIFLKQINGTNRGGNPADTDGGSTKDAANLRCTYAETRFLVQIWTRSKDSKPLLQNSTSDASAVFRRPGTFPYPVTVTIDRHGGDPAKKNLYCYSIESDGTIKNEASKRAFQFEDRAFGGNLVNGTQGRGIVTGSIDGGTGGCRCQWQNWLN